MHSKIVPVGSEAIAEAAEILRAGGLVVAPSRTHYGVCCDPRNETAIERIFEAKKRTKFGPLTLAIPDPATIGEYVDLPPGLDAGLLGRMLPGLVTPIFRKKYPFPERMTMGAPTVGIMCQGDCPMYDVSAAFGPIALTSANLSGAGDALVGREQAIDQLGKSVDLIIDGGPATWDPNAGNDQSNTVVDFTFTPPHLVRPGRFRAGDLVALFPDLVTDPAEYKKVLTARMGQVRL